MSRETIEVVRCDMCGKEIDINSKHDLLMSAIGGNQYTVLVKSHDASLDGLRQNMMAFECMDLCVECADRACAIHCEVVSNEDERTCHRVYSWRDGR